MPDSPVNGLDRYKENIGVNSLLMMLEDDDNIIQCIQN
jgi:hypothetical protein